MHKLMGKAVSVLLSLAMVMTSFSVPVYAEEIPVDSEAVVMAADESYVDENQIGEIPEEDPHSDDVQQEDTAIGTDTDATNDTDNAVTQGTGEEETGEYQETEPAIGLDAEQDIAAEEEMSDAELSLDSNYFSDPELDETYGIGDDDGFDGIKFIRDGRKVSYSFQIPKDNYKDIVVGDGEVLKLYVEHAAEEPIVNNKDHKRDDGFYQMAGATCTVDQTADKLTIEYPLFDYLKEDYKGKFRLRLQYVIIEKDRDNNPDDFINMDDWSNVLSQGKRVELEYSVNIGATAALSAPTLDTTYGCGGIDYSFEPVWDEASQKSKDKLSISFRVPKSDYEGIELSDNEILKLVFYYGTKKANLKNSESPYTSGDYKGYYIGWNAETVKAGEEVRDYAATGGMEGEIHDFNGDYFTVTVPLFYPYDGKYLDNIHVGLEYVIMDKSDCPNAEHETIDRDKTIDGPRSDGFYKKPAFVSLQYYTDEEGNPQVDAKIKDGIIVVEPYDTTTMSIDTDYDGTADLFLAEAHYALDGAKNYTFETTPVSGYQINKVAYSSVSSHTTWKTTQTFKPSGDGYLIYVDSQATYSPVVSRGEGESSVELSPDSKGVYSASYIDTINFKIKKGTNTITPAKIVTKVGSKVIETIEEGGSLKFNGSGTYHGQKVTVELYEAGIEKAVTTCYVQVTAPIRSVTLKNTKVLNPAIEGAPVTSVVTVNAGADVNKLGFVCYQGMVNGKPDFVDVSLENGVLTITPKENCATNKSFDIYFYNSEEVTDPKWWSFGEIEGGRFTVTMQPPEWANKTPNASLVSANDYQLDFKVTAPSGVKLNDEYYVAVKLISNKNTAKGLKEGLSVNDTVKYFKINEDGTFPQVSLNAFSSGGSEVETLGEGCGASMDAEFYVVKTLNGEVPNTDESNVLASTVSKNHKKLTVSTKSPYYAEKITFKKTAAASKLYAGQSMVKVADVNLGNNTTFNTTDYWTITSIVDPSGDEILGVTNIITVATGEAAGKSKTDTGIYLNVDETAVAGKYKIKVQPKVGETLILNEVVLDVTVVPTIGRLDVSVNGVKIGEKTYQVYKAPGKKSNIKSTVSAEDQDGKKISKPTVTYVVGVLNAEENDIVTTNVPGLTVDKSGTISITNDFGAKEGETYALMVKAADYAENNNKDIIKLDIRTSQSVDVKTIEVYTFDGTKYELVEGKTAIPVDMTQIFVAVKNKAGEYVLGSADAPISLYTREDWSNDNVFVDGIEFLSACSKLTKPGKVKLTAYGMDGTKATADINFTYRSDNMDFNDIKVAIPKPEGKTQVFEDDGSFSLDGYPTNQKVRIWLSQGADTTYDVASDTLSYMVEGSLKVSGAKILRQNSNSQYLEIQMTKSPATVTLSKKTADGKKTTTKTVTFTNDAFGQVAAPGVKSVLVNGTDKVYADYIYNSGDTLRITLNDVIKDASKNKVDPDKVKVAITDESGEVFVTDTATYHVFEDAKGKDVAYVEMPANSQYAAQSYKVSLLYYTEETGGDYSYLTKAPTAVSFSPAKFKTSFSITATQNMSQKDAYAIYPLCKGTGVVTATLVGLGDFNSKGQYSEFTKAYKCEAGQLKVKDASKINVANNVGYMTFEVVFENGKTEYYTGKVTVKWSEKQIGKYNITKAWNNNSAGAEFGGIKIKDSNGNDCEVLAMKLSTAKGNSPCVEDIHLIDPVNNEDDIGLEGYEGEIIISITDPAGSVKVKKGTYKATAIAILKNSGFVGGTPTDADYSKYGTEVTVTITVPGDTIRV